MVSPQDDAPPSAPGGGVRELGYRGYKGERLAPDQNIGVLCRYGLHLAWSSWLTKVAVFLSPLPGLALIVVQLFRWYLASKGAEIHPDPAGDSLAFLARLQIVIFATLVTLGGGATAIVDDKRARAFAFFFAKPVTPRHYVIGRVVASGTFVLLVTAPILTLYAAVLVATGPQADRLDQIGLVIASFLHCTVVAIVLGAASVAISSLGTSRAVNMTSWALLLVVPASIAAVFASPNQLSWPALLSLPHMLFQIGDAFYKAQSQQHAAQLWLSVLILAIVGFASVWQIHRAVQNVEVIS